MRGLHVLVLGHGRIELDGQALTRLMSPKHQAIVYFLAASEAPAARGRLAALLWGGLDEPAARANLRVALTRLRRWLPGLLDIDDRQVAFAAGTALHVDWREVTAALRDPTDEARVEQAAAAWRGPLLDGFEIAGSDEFEHWLAQSRRRAQRDVVELRRGLLQRACADGRRDAAIAHAHALLEVDESDETAHMALMQLLAAGGQRTAALAQYEICRAVLADRLGARPSAECYALYTRIHAEHGAMAPASATLAPASAPAVGAAAPASPPVPAGRGESLPAIDAAALALHGRASEIALLRARLADPHCRWLTIIGPGGVGKTRLAQAVAAEIAPHLPHGVLWFNGRDRGGALRDGETLTQAVIDHVGADRTASRDVLVVLDNLETVPDARRLGALLAQHVPGAVVLATSRVRVGGPREWLLELGGLALARAACDRPASSPAAALLTAGVQRLMPDFDPALHAEAVESICARVGGLPLALEMAARTVPQQGAGALAARLAAGAPLADPDRDADDHQRSIERVFDDSWALLDDDTRTAALRLAWVGADVDAALAAVVGVGAETFATLRAHSWLQPSGDERFALHPLQQDHLRRRPGAEASRAEVVAAMAAHLDAAMPAVAPFGDLPLPAEGAAAAPPTLGAAERLVRSAAGSAAVLAECAAHLCTAAPLAQLVPWIDRAVALLGHADRQGEAAALLLRALQRSDLPPWQRAGWALRRAEYLSADGATHAAVAACRDALADFGLGDAGFHRAAWAALPRAVARIVAQRDWPPPGAPRAAFEALLLRSLVWQAVRLSFSPDPWPGASLGLLANTLCARTRGDPAVRDISTSFGLQALGRPRLATAAWRRGMASSGAALDVRCRVQLDAGRGVLAFALGQWAGLTGRLDEVAGVHALLHDGRTEMEQRSLAAKLAFYEGRLNEAARRFAALSEASLRRPGEAWRAWGPIGQAEVGLCLGTPVATLQPLLDRAAHAMTELEMLDAAYTLRRLGLAAQLAWRAGDTASAREAVLAGCAAAARLRYCGFWAHEGFAGLALVAAALRRAERAAGARSTPLDAPWLELQAAIARHARRFPPARSLHLLVRSQTAVARGRAALARTLLERAVRAAEVQGMRVDLARCCEALHALAPSQGWASRAQGLWHEMAG